jgi:hypothetical protein
MWCDGDMSDADVMLMKSGLDVVVSIPVVASPHDPAEQSIPESIIRIMPHVLFHRFKATARRRYYHPPGVARPPASIVQMPAGTSRYCVRHADD